MQFEEFTSAAELKAHYARVATRMAALKPPPPKPKPLPPPPPPKPEPEPEPKSAPTAQHRRLPSMQIMVAVSTEFDVPISVIRGGARMKHIVIARQVTVLLLHELLGRSMPASANLVGCRDHTSAISGIKAIHRKMARDHTLAARVARLRAKLLELE